MIKRVPVGETRLALAVKMAAPSGGGGEPALGFDRAGADQGFPVVLAGLQREGRGQEDQLRSCAAKREKQFRKRTS